LELVRCHRDEAWFKAAARDRVPSGRGAGRRIQPDGSNTVAQAGCRSPKFRVVSALSLP
jgi:hypothetical protein